MSHFLWLVSYLGLADNSRGPLLSRLRGLSPLVVRSQNGLSAPYAALLSCLSTHRSCLLTYRSRAVGQSFSWFIRYRTWGCGQGGTRESSTSLRDQTCSVKPAAIASVHGRHTLTEP